MVRLFAAVLVVIGGTAPCSATSYRVLSVPELVARADVIVVGTVTVDGDNCRASVVRTLAGKAGREVEFLWHPDADLTPGQPQVLFLKIGKERLSLVYPFATRPAERADEVARLVAMRADPGKYLADTRASATPEFLETLGWAFVGRQKVGSLNREAVIAHLRRSLGGREPMAVLAALAALQRVGSKDVAGVVPLIRHRDETVRLAAIRFLEWAPDKAAVGPLCEILDGIDGFSELEDPVGRALGEIGDPAAVPALERAAKWGRYGATSRTLDRLGGKQSCELLMAGVDHESMDALEGMMWTARRSNEQFEPWMATNEWSAETGLMHKDDRRRWWEANRATIEVVRTVTEAFRRER